MLDLFNDDQPKRKRKTIPRAVSNTVWAKYIGINKPEGQCYVCRRTIHITDFDVGHNKAIAKGGKDNISNLRPICRTCNASMGTQSIESFKAKHFGQPKKDLRPMLQSLGVQQLKSLAAQHGVKVSGRIAEGFFTSARKPPTKSQYVARLNKVVTEKELRSLLE